MAGSTKKKTSNSKNRNTRSVSRKSTAKNSKPIKVLEIMGIVLTALGILTGAFVYTSSTAVFAQLIRNIVFGMFGIFGYLVPIFLVAFGFIYLFSVGINSRKAVFFTICFWLLAAFVELCSPKKYAPSAINYINYIVQAFNNGTEKIGGGVIGAILGYPLEALFSKAGALIILATAMLVLIVLITNFSIRDGFEKLSNSVRNMRESARNERLEREARKQQYIEERVEDEDEIYQKAFSDQEYARPSENARPGATEILGSQEEKRRPSKKDTAIDPDVIIDPRDQQVGLMSNDIGKGKKIPQTGTGEVQAQLFRDDKNKAKPQVDGKKKPFFAKKKSNHLDIQTSIEDEYNKQLAEDYYVDDEEEEPYTGEFNFYSTNHKKEDIKPKEKKEPEKTAYFTPPPSEMKEKEPAEEPEEEKTDEKKEEKKEHKPYMLPFRMDLLDKPVQSDYGRRMEKSNLSKANLLEEAFQNFHIDVKINNIVIGPSVTRYELTPAPGVKISRITALANDIALYLAAPSVRIEAPIPGKSAVGIEVPNSERMGVKIRELLDTPEFKNNKSSIFFGLGKDINGNNVYGDLAKMPHLLIAGTTGSGKSVCINSIIMSILYKSSPEEVNMLMVDPKVVEMKRFNGIPHMKTKVVTDPKKATSMLNYVVNEMQKRYKIFADTNVKEIDSYNKYMLSQGEKIIPKLVVIIDELADLMMASKHEVEDAICRIAQLGRAAGIHLVVATQTPRADVLTGMIKTNISSRIALTVSSGLDSRIILDMNGAEDLLGNGDMLFMPIGQSKPVRLQGCYISDEENERVIDFLKNNTDEMEKDEELERQLIEGVEPAASISEVGEEQDKSSFDDPLTQKAIELAFEYGNISSSMIMRRLKVGYARAARIVDEMELKEIVPPADGNKPRPLQITYDEFQRMIGKDEEE